MGVHALAQGRTLWNNAQAQCALEEGALAKALNSIKVAFTHAQQGKIRFEDFTVGNDRAHRELGVDQRINIDALEAFTDKCQASMGAEVVRQFFDMEVDHVRSRLLSESCMRAKSLISMGKSTYLDYEVTDSGAI